MSAPVVLITRPQPEADVFAKALLARDYAPLVAPLMEIVPLHYEPDEQARSVLITSRHALHIAQRQPELKALPWYVVGEDTANKTREAGIENVTHAQDVASLLPLIPTGASPLLYARGSHVARDAAFLLGSRGIRVREAIVYDTRECSALPPAAREMLECQAIAAAPFFSLRTAQLFAYLIQAAGLKAAVKPIHAIAISDAVASALRALPWASVSVAAMPDAQSIIAEMDKRLRTE